MWVSLPWAWPSAHRRWAEDHSTRFTRSRVDDGLWQVHPWTVWDHVEQERMSNELLAEVGVAPPPAGRLWLLRPPARFADLDAALLALAASAVERGAQHRMDAGFHAALVAVLDGWAAAGWT